jgi:hypothetical protein
MQAEKSTDIERRATSAKDARTLGPREFVLGVLLTVGTPMSVWAAGIDVSQNGNPSYRYEFVVPPGRGGLQPKLSLNYTGASPGLAGAGWDLGGISRVHRCAGIRAVDGQFRALRYDDNDKLCLDGMRLLQTDSNGVVSAFPQAGDASAVPDSSFREFRLENDTITRIRAYGANTTGGPQYFEIITADGLLREYGAAPTDAFTKAFHA